jgi:hypothetical protein
MTACPKCGQSNQDHVRFCTRCHFPLRVVCPACKHVQREGGVCEACGVEFLKYGMAQVSRLKVESEREIERMKKRSALLREVLLAIGTGGFSLLKYLRPRR